MDVCANTCIGTCAHVRVGKGTGMHGGKCVDTSAERCVFYISVGKAVGKGLGICVGKGVCTHV